MRQYYKDCVIDCPSEGIGSCYYPTTCVGVKCFCDKCGKKVDKLYDIFWEGVEFCKECIIKEIEGMTVEEHWENMLEAGQIVRIMED